MTCVKRFPENDNSESIMYNCKRTGDCSVIGLPAGAFFPARGIQSDIGMQPCSGMRRLTGHKR